MKTKSTKFAALVLTGITVLTFSCSVTKTTPRKSTVFSDAMHKTVIQTIPGKLECELYHHGGEGIAFHDTDSINRGSGRLNKGSDYLSTFRINEGVDISFTKFHDSIDNSKYNKVHPKEGQLYVGWTEPGEWMKYTVNIIKSGTYNLDVMYTANKHGEISISSNKSTATAVIAIASTFHKNDPLTWRQWHHWNFVTNAGSIYLEEGINTITLTILKSGQMNLDFIRFNLQK